MKTTKQDLVRQINKLQNELNTLNGVQTYSYTAYDIAEEARKHAVYELESKIESLTKQVEQTKHQIKVNEYWNDNADERIKLEQQRFVCKCDKGTLILSTQCLNRCTCK